jgi:polysaccharide deacetylase 2 family uncharacterized protein YibQ
MTESTASSLDAPLVRKRARAGQAGAGSRRRHLPVARLAFAGLAILVLGVTTRLVFVETPDGGRPSAEVPINNKRDGNSIAGANASPLPGASTLTVGPEVTPDEVEEALAAPAPPDVADTSLPDAYGMVADLVEESEYGPIPRVSAAGQTPFSAYSRPSVSAAAAAGKPRIAIIVTGLGINLSGTLDTIAALPDTTTLAFAPYGKSLERTVGAARAEGHEIFLEVPLEPFDYPENDPGPDTLLTGQAPRDNMDKLYRVMGKFGGYAGLINNMGARFTASGADFGPMMEELGARGLGYIDDGSSNRSLAPQLAQANRVPFARADGMIDANPARAPILEALAQLEAKAQRNGQAIGLIAALPVSVQTVAEWAREAESRGFLLVPASALMQP